MIESKRHQIYDVGFTILLLLNVNFVASKCVHSVTKMALKSIYNIIIYK